MKITTKLILLGMVGITAAPFIVKKPDGSPYISLNQLRSYSEQAVQKTKQAVDSSPSQMYRWQDSEGKWHYSDKPSDQYSSSSVNVETTVNSMKDIELPEGFGEEEKDEGNFDPTNGSTLPLTTAPLEKVPDMLKEIERVQEKMKEQQKVLNDL